MYDILFKNGTIVDGSGSPAFAGDLAVQGDRLAALERIERAGGIPEERARRVFDIFGCYICPGFIDLHTHSDFPLLLDGRALSAVYQGVCTQVIGNCGFSPAPLRRPADMRRSVFSFREPYTPAWKDFPAFLEHLAELSMGTNAAALLGHGALKNWAMGAAAESSGPEGAKSGAWEKVLRRELERAMDAGAFGLSSGLEYAPGSSTDEEEMGMLAGVVASRGGLYATHVRNRDEDYKRGFEEAFRSAEKSGVRLQISHAVPKYGAPAGAAEWVLGRLQEAAERFDTAADVIPYEWGPTSLSAVLPKRLLALSPERIAEELASKEVLEEVMNQKRPFWLQFRDKRWDLIRLYYSSMYPQLRGKSALEIGGYFSLDPFEGLLKILRDEGPGLFSVLMMGKIKRGEDLELLIGDPRTAVISDAMSLATAGPLADFFWSPGCYGWVPRFLSRFAGIGSEGALGRGKGSAEDSALLPIEEAVRKITGLPAARLGISDRGLLREGLKADVTVVDPGSLRERATMEEPRRYAEGFPFVLCNGQLLIEKGRYTGALPGRLLRRV